MGDLQMDIFFLNLPYPACIISCGIISPANRSDPHFIVNSLPFSIQHVNKAFGRNLIGKGRSLNQISFANDLLHVEEQGKFFKTVKTLIALSVNYDAVAADTADKDGYNILGVKTLTLADSSLGAFPTVSKFDWNINLFPGSGDEVLLMATGFQSSIGENLPEWSIRKRKVPQNDERLDDSQLIFVHQKSPIALHWLSAEGVILWANDAELELLQYMPDEYIGQSIFKFCMEEKDHMSEVIARLANGEAIRNESFKFYTKSGDAKFLLMDSTVSWDQQGKFARSECVIRDDTDRRIQQAVDEAEISKLSLVSAAKDKFIRRIFHEIRTPLHFIYSSLNSHTFDAEVEKAHSSVLTEYHEDLRNQMDRCLGLVEDLAFATMLENDNILESQLCVLNIDEEIDGVINKLRSLDDYKTAFATLKLRIVIDKKVPRTIVADTALLRVLHNLISNAIRFTSETNGEVDITLKFSSESAHFPVGDTSSQRDLPLKINNTNKSPGMAMDADFELVGLLSFTIRNSVARTMDIVAVNKAFQHYYEAETDSSVSSLEGTLTNALTATSQGMGLGLYVSYNIVEIMGGRLECAATDEDSTFWFTVPVKYQAPFYPTATITKASVSSVPPRPSSQGQVTTGTVDPTQHSNNGSSSSSSDGRNRKGHLFHYREVEKWTSVTDCSAAAQHVLLNGGESSISSASSRYSEPSPLLVKKRRILVVDDSPICQKVMTRILRTNYYDSDVASNGQEAVGILSTIPCIYDLVLMDLRMPIMDGITATSICKGMHHLKNVPFIIVTAELGEDVRAAAMQAHASFFIKKPAKEADIKAVIDTFLF